jgi:hypothetical protein
MYYAYRERYRNIMYIKNTSFKTRTGQVIIHNIITSDRNKKPEDDTSIQNSWLSGVKVVFALVVAMPRGELEGES